MKKEKGKKKAFAEVLEAEPSEAGITSRMTHLFSDCVDRSWNLDLGVALFLIASEDMMD